MRGRRTHRRRAGGPTATRVAVAGRRGAASGRRSERHRITGRSRVAVTGTTGWRATATKATAASARRLGQRVTGQEAASAPRRWTTRPRRPQVHRRIGRPRVGGAQATARLPPGASVRTCAAGCATGLASRTARAACFARGAAPARRPAGASGLAIAAGGAKSLASRIARAASAAPGGAPSRHPAGAAGRGASAGSASGLASRMARAAFAARKVAVARQDAPVRRGHAHGSVCRGPRRAVSRDGAMP